MANLAVELKQGYERWIGIAQSQLFLLQQQPTDEKYELLNKLEMDKRAIKLVVMEKTEQSDSLDAHVREQVGGYIEKLQLINNEVQPLLEAWYSDASAEMKQASTQRRILNSYGGTQNSDIISYYVDSKK